MAGRFNEDESTEDELDVDFRFGERLRINRGESCNFIKNKIFENNKDFKQFCNMNRKKNSQEAQSSSSSSIETPLDYSTSGSIISDSYHNKKRQNGDKSIEQSANPKRTCLNDRFSRLPDWQNSKKKINNSDAQSETCLFPDSFYMHPGTSSDKFNDKKCVDHSNDLADTEESDFEVPVKFNIHTKTDGGQSSKNSKNQFSAANKIEKFENKASKRYFQRFLDSDSEEEVKPVVQNGALKGGRQESTTDQNKKLVSHKINRRVLDSDESEDDNPVAKYRSKPFVFSSSDSEDFEQTIAKHKYRGASSNGASNHPHGDNFEESSDSHCNKYTTFQSNPKFAKKIRSFNRADISDGCDRNFHSADFQRKNASHRLCKNRRNAMPSNSTINSFAKSSSSAPARHRRTSGAERSTRRSGSPHHRSNRCPHKADEVKCHGRSVSMSRTQTTRPNYYGRFADMFDAEESDNEFFTANSYSDTETSTESLGGLTINATFNSPNDSVSCRVGRNIFKEYSSDDEISVVFTSGPSGRNNEGRRVTPRTLGRRHFNGNSQRQIPNAEEMVSLSPDPVEQVRQVEEDERMARMLQAQFDAEIDPDYVAPSSQANEDSDEDDAISSIRFEISDSDESSSPNGFMNPYLLSIRRGAGRNRFSSNRSRVPATLVFGNRRANSRSRLRNPNSHLEFISFPNNAANFDSFFSLQFGPSLNDYEALLSLDLDDDAIPRGLPRSDINRLPTRNYIHPNSALSSNNSEVSHKRTELNKECQVCLCDYETGDVLRILPCFHEFHIPCIDPWLTINHTCPVCRVTVDLDA